MAIVGSAIGAVGSFLGGREEKKAAQAAADAQVQAAKIAADEQKRQFDAMMNRTEPQYQLGLSALGKQGFYAGVQSPTAFNNKLSEIGVTPYPSISSYDGNTTAQTYLPAVTSPSAQTANWLAADFTPEGTLFGNPLPTVTNQQWLEDFMRQQAADSNKATKDWLYGQG